MKIIVKMIAMAGLCLIIGNSQPANASSTIISMSPGLPANFLAMKLGEFIKLPARDFGTITGKKLNLKERIAFFLLKKKMKRSWKFNPDQTVKDFLAATHEKRKTKALVIILIVLAVISLVFLIVLSTMNISFGG